MSGRLRGTSSATKELATLVVRLAEARICLDRSRGSHRRGPAMARLLAVLIRDLDMFFASHGSEVDAAFQVALRRDMRRLGEAVLELQEPVGRA